MTWKTILSALALLLSATTISLAQSLPNYGPNAPATGDSFGKPYSGANPCGEVRVPMPTSGARIITLTAGDTGIEIVPLWLGYAPLRLLWLL
jgi:hypothetical protein